MTDIVITDVTTGVVDGTGAFDKLMTAGTAHLDAQYADNRLTGKDYATVYLGMMQAAMAQGLQFVLGEQQADKQAELLTKQTAEVAASTIRNDAQSAKQVLLLQEQADKTTAEEALLAQKKVTETAQTVNATGGTMKKQQDLITAQTDGFARDAEQKLAKIFADVYAINRTSLGSSASVPGGLDDIDISAIVAKAASGIDVTLNVTPPP